MDFLITTALFIVGLSLVLFCAEQLVKGVVGTSLNFGMSAFLVSVVFIGFDPDNLSVGTIASYEQATGIAWGSIIGAAMVAVALAFGITALVAPMKFKKVPGNILMLAPVAVALPAMLAIDGLLSRLDGVILLGGFVFCIYTLVKLGRIGIDIKATGEVAESLERAGEFPTWKAIAYLLGSLLGIIIGSELLIYTSRDLIAVAGLTETFFGMTILALLVSIEELARELPAALKGRPDISFGNVVGSVFAMLLFNGGIIALVRPIPLQDSVLYFYFPYLLGTVILVSIIMWRKKVSRLAGLMLVIIYIGFVLGSWIVGL